MWRDGRFRWSALIVLALLVAALALGWKNYTTVKAEQTRAQTESRESWESQGERNPHSAAHFGVYAFRPKIPLSLVDSGLDNFTGTNVWVEAHYQNPLRGRPIEDATALQRFGELTAAGVLQLLLPLVIIFLAFDAFAGERTAGTLRQILSFGVSRSSLVFGKTLGFLAALLLLLIPATIIGVSALALATANDTLLSSLPRFTLLCVSYLLYLAAFVGIALTVSALASTTRTALIILLGFWIFSCLIAPRIANDLAEKIYPAPSAAEFWADVDADLKQGIDGHDTANKRLNSEFLWLKSSLSSQTDDDRLFAQDIYRNRTVYQFSRFHAVRSIADYDTLERRIGLSLLYGYTPRPNTAFFVGYGDALFNGFDPLFETRRAGLIRQSRSLFAKVSYNFRF